MLSRLLHRFVTWHWQDLNERPDGPEPVAPDPIPLHGRAWLWRRVPDHQIIDEARQRLGRLEWAIGLRDSAGAGIELDGEDDEITISLGTPLAAVYVSVALPRAVREWLGYERRTISLRAHDGAIWWTVWRDPMGDWERGKVRRWREGSYRIVDKLLGAPVHSERIIRESDVALPLPEGDYPAHAKLREQTWTRPRWPFPTRHMAVSIDAPGGVPSDHKGPTFGLHTTAGSIAEGVGKFVTSILKSRAPNHPHQWKRVGELERAACLKRAAERAQGKEHADA